MQVIKHLAFYAAGFCVLFGALGICNWLIENTPEWLQWIGLAVFLFGAWLCFAFALIAGMNYLIKLWTGRNN